MSRYIIFVLLIAVASGCQKDEDFTFLDINISPDINPTNPWHNWFSDYYFVDVHKTIESDHIRVKFTIGNAGKAKGSDYHLIIYADCKYYDRRYPSRGLKPGAKQTHTIGLPSYLLGKSVKIAIVPVQGDELEKKNGLSNNTVVWGSRCRS